MNREIENMVKIGSYKVLFKSQGNFLLTLRYKFVDVSDFLKEEQENKQALTVLMIAGS